MEGTTRPSAQIRLGSSTESITPPVIGSESLKRTRKGVFRFATMRTYGEIPPIHLLPLPGINSSLSHGRPLVFHRAGVAS
jgi:hypothetical protein